MRSLVHALRWRLGLVAIKPWMMPEETARVVQHARGKHRLAEIGVWEGGSTRLIREVMAADATLFAIDPYSPGRLGISYQRLIAAGEVGRVKNGAVVWLRQTGVEAARLSAVREHLFDFVLIDGDHTYEGLRRDWLAWSPLIAPGGIVALHDSVMPESQAGCGSIDYSNEVIAHDSRFEPVDTAWTLRVLRRRA